MRHANRDEHGFVLLAALAALAVLAFLGARLLGASRTDLLAAAAARDAALVETEANSAVSDVVMRLLHGAWPIAGLSGPGPPVVLTARPVLATVRVTDEAGKIDVNRASAPLLRALLEGAGMAAYEARDLAERIVEWRRPGEYTPDGEAKRSRYAAMGVPYAPSNRPFDGLDEVERVLGMTQAIFAAIRDSLTVYDLGDINLEAAPPMVLAAVQAARASDPNAGKIGFPSPDRVVRIEASASTRSARFTRVAVVRLKGQPSTEEAPYQVLTWEIGGRVMPSAR